MQPALLPLAVHGEARQYPLKVDSRHRPHVNLEEAKVLVCQIRRARGEGVGQARRGVVKEVEKVEQGPAWPEFVVAVEAEVSGKQ